ncbi:hypothetical protein TRIUR3_11062 [Triticum urartu]|uniref:Uncharacterized protein n=1 Tax=Triticum urartu TaxID=4572 RepID=M7Z1J4_TRIUA|nr:hypothetical protein TRIUR3_11062 [Triticum urartu]
MTPPPRQLDMWSAIQALATKPEPPAVKAKAGYPMATVRRSMSHESLSLCTESLGCETGTRGDFLDLASLLYAPPPSSHLSKDAVADDDSVALQDEEEEQEETAAGELRAVHYHRARPQPRARGRGHETPGIPPRAARGHQKQSMVQQQQPDQERMLQEKDVEEVVDDEEDEVEKEEDEVEVVDRGMVVEVVAASGKAQRCSRIVINKFVGGAPVTTDDANTIPSPSRCCRATENELAAPTASLLGRAPFWRKSYSYLSSRQMRSSISSCSLADRARTTRSRSSSCPEGRLSSAPMTARRGGASGSMALGESSSSGSLFTGMSCEGDVPADELPAEQEPEDAWRRRSSSRSNSSSSQW